MTFDHWVEYQRVNGTCLLGKGFCSGWEVEGNCSRRTSREHRVLLLRADAPDEAAASLPTSEFVYMVSELLTEGRTAVSALWL